MLNYSANGPSGYNLTNSLRFRSSASAYLSKTYGSNGNTKTWTYSFWAKLGTLSTEMSLLSVYSSVGYQTRCTMGSGNAMSVQIYNSGSYNSTWDTAAVYRDPSAWYHIMFVGDTTGTTASNYIKIYVNGVQQTTTYNLNGQGAIPQNTNILVCSTIPHTIGRYQGGANYFDGYFAETYLIDGQALTPSSFGSTNATTGVWQPAKYTGTYGTNGFYLNFNSIALTSGSNTGLGKDNSGNGNYFNTNNISVTAGTTYDAMTDVPTLTSATVGNYCTLNPLLRSYSSITNANTTMTTTGGAGSNQWTLASGTQFPTSGKWYFEIYVNTKTSDAGGSSIGVGIQSNQANTTYPLNNYLGQQTTGEYNYQAHGYTFFNNVQSGSPVWASYTTGDTIGVAYDLDGLTCYWYKNNTLQGSTSLLSGYGYAPAFSIYQASQATLNCGQRPFTYTPPSGYVAVNTFNLPTSTIVQGNKYMDATTYTGTGATLNVTNTAGFKPDLVWAKARNQAYNNGLFDSVRGISNQLVSNSTGAESVASGVTAFNSNGFTLGTNPGYNENASTFVGWQWQAGQGSTSSNTSGTITSTVSVNASAGFSVVTYTGAGTSAGTVGHGLGVAPKLIIAKTRGNAQAWVAYHSDLGINKYLILNATDAVGTISNYWGSATPTSTVFGVYTGNNIGNNNYLSISIVAYCWAEIAGFSKFGSYTGNGSTDGPFVFTNFQPKFIMIKRTDTTDNWYILDSVRNTYNVAGELLEPNLTNVGSQYDSYDFLSNGFKLRNTGAGVNASGGTYIYACFASNPFKNSNAR